MRIIDHLCETVYSIADHNTKAQAPPACILWPDHDRQLQAAMPELNGFLRVHS